VEAARRTGGWLALALLVVAEQVSFAGQPTGDPTGEAIAQYYTGHHVAIVLGNVLWLIAAVLLAVSVVRRAHGLPPVADKVQSALAVTGPTVMAATSATALSLAFRAEDLTPADAHALWHIEGTLFTAAVWLWLLVAIIGLAGMRAKPWVAVMMGLLLVGALVDVAGAGWWLVVSAVATYVASEPHHGDEEVPDVPHPLSWRSTG
jgi:hypothetical protein